MLVKIRKYLLIILMVVIVINIFLFITENDIKSAEDLNNNKKVASEIDKLNNSINEIQKNHNNSDIFNIVFEEVCKALGLSLTTDVKSESVNKWTNNEKREHQLARDALRILEMSDLYNYENGWIKECKYVDEVTDYQRTSQDTQTNIDAGIVISENWNNVYFEKVMEWSPSKTREILNQFNQEGQIFKYCTRKELMEVFNLVFDTTWNKVENETAELNLNENQIAALTTIRYLYGNIGNFVDVYKKYGDSTTMYNSFYVVTNGKVYYPLSAQYNDSLYLGRTESTVKIFEGDYNLPGYHVKGGRIVLKK